MIPIFTEVDENYRLAQYTGCLDYEDDIRLPQYDEHGKMKVGGQVIDLWDIATFQQKKEVFKGLHGNRKACAIALVIVGIGIAIFAIIASTPLIIGFSALFLGLTVYSLHNEYKYYKLFKEIGKHVVVNTRSFFESGHEKIIEEFGSDPQMLKMLSQSNEENAEEIGKNILKQFLENYRKEWKKLTEEENSLDLYILRKQGITNPEVEAFIQKTVRFALTNLLKFRGDKTLFELG